jgi:probable rRNA maturation factor
MPSPDPVEVDVTIDAEAPIPAGVTEEALVALTRHVLSEEGVSGGWEIGVRFVDDAVMQAAHRDFMGIDSPTDIMTFPYEDDDTFILRGGDSVTAEISGGDLLISVDTAAANARDAGWALEEELRFLVCHGLLHLLGWADGNNEERAAMLGRQAALMRSFVEAG